MELQEEVTLRIAICDDDIPMLDRLRRMTEQVLDDQWETDIFCTDSPEELLEQSDRMQIALLDIQMPEENGIALAQKILEKAPGCQIIFVSGYIQFVSDVYDVPHMSMILKDQMDLQLPKYLLRAAEACRNQGWDLSFRVNGVEYTLNMEMVSFLERRGHITYITLQNGQQFQTREKLDTLLEGKEHPCLCRCHVSFAVNLKWVASMREKEFVMANGDIVPISRVNKQMVKKQYFDYLKTKI